MFEGTSSGEDELKKEHKEEQKHDIRNVDGNLYLRWLDGEDMPPTLAEDIAVEMGLHVRERDGVASDSGNGARFSIHLKQTESVILVDTARSNPNPNPNPKPR